MRGEYFFEKFFRFYKLFLIKVLRTYLFQGAKFFLAVLATLAEESSASLGRNGGSSLRTGVQNDLNNQVIAVEL